MNTGSYEIKPRLTKTGKPKKGAGYDVFHVSPTRRVWVSHAVTMAAAREVRTTKRNGSLR